MIPTRVYCKYSTFRDVYLNRKTSPRYGVLYAIISKLSDLYLDIPKAEIDQLCIKEPSLKQLAQNGNKNIRHYHDIIYEIEHANYGDIFILDEDVLDAREIRERKGILVVEKDEDMFLFERLAYKHFRPYSLAPKGLILKSPFYEASTTWANIFSKTRIEPINSLVITDNFLFSKKERNIHSLYTILKNIVPNKLDVPFHLTIFFNNEPKSNYTGLTSSDAKKIIREIRSLNLTKEIQIQLIAHSDTSSTHDRIILSNYHYIVSGVGFNVIDSNGVQQVARGWIESVFHNIAEISAQTTIKHIHSQTLEWLQNILDKKHKFFIEGDEFRNRLFLPIKAFNYSSFSR